MQPENVPVTRSFEASVDEIETLQEIDIDAARKALRLLLFDQAGAKPQGTIGDALGILAERSTEFPNVAAAILRFLAIQNLIPEDIPQNQIARSCAAIIEGSRAPHHEAEIGDAQVL